MDFNYLLAGVIGALVGAVELIGRYRDAPLAALSEPTAWMYIIVNGLASLVAYHLVVIFAVRFGIDNDPARLATVRVMTAAFAAMAFFRTSLFTTRVGNADIPVGPGLIFQILLNVTDRSVDRERAVPRAERVPVLMADIDFDKAKEALPAFCFGIMQNVGTSEQTAAREQVAIVASKGDLSGPLKSTLLGLLIVNLVGVKVLDSAIKALGSEILRAPPTPPAP